MTYFTFSQGFRPGGFNRSVSAVADLNPKSTPQFEKPNAYAPNSLTNYEVGLKTELFDHRLQVNLSAYYMQWDNVQFLFFDPTQLGNTTFGVNGPNYDVKGIEFQIVGRVTDQLTIQGSGSYDDDTQSSSPCLKDNIAGTPAFGNCITQVNGQPFQNPFGALGTVPAFSPSFQGNVRARYDWEMGDYKAFVMVGANYTGSMYNQPATYTSGAGVLIPNTTYPALSAAGLHHHRRLDRGFQGQLVRPALRHQPDRTPTPACSRPRPSSSSRRCRCGRWWSG